MSKQLEQYVKVSIPEPYTILGCKLHPLSLGHLMLMKRFDCAFGPDEVEREGNIWDLLLGVAICSRTYKEFIDWYSNQNERDIWLCEWLDEIKKEMKTNKNWCLMNKFSLFNMYRRESIDIPKYFDEGDNDSRESGAHWIQNVQTTLMTESGYTEDELLDMPVAKALYLYYKILENNGQVTLMADWQIEEEERLLAKADKPKETVNG